MYKLLLILKYLRKRRIAWVSLIAVMLCTTMVLVVISIMGGWLRMFKESFHGLGGDLIVESRSLTGFANYDEIIEKIEALPEIDARVRRVVVVPSELIVRLAQHHARACAVEIGHRPLRTSDTRCERCSQRDREQRDRDTLQGSVHPHGQSEMTGDISYPTGISLRSTRASPTGEVSAAVVPQRGPGLVSRTRKNTVSRATNTLSIPTV